MLAVTMTTCNLVPGVQGRDDEAEEPQNPAFIGLAFSEGDRKTTDKSIYAVH